MRTSALLAVSLLAVCACGPIPDPRGGDALDLVPPVFEGCSAVGPDQVELRFSEPATVDPAEVVIEPALAVYAAESHGNTVLLAVDTQTPGRRHVMEVMATDARGNFLLFMTEFYGHNPDPAAVVLNEFITQGSTTHPDLLELLAWGGGDMGGLVVYQGTPGSYTDRLVFPAFRVAAGDFLLVHFKPEGLPEELDETADKAASGGLDASDNAFDFWVSGGTGLSGNNGVLSLYRQVGGLVMDAVVYSNRTSDSDELYGGFGTRATYDRVLEIGADGGWLAEDGAIAPEDPVLDPEDAVNPEDSTSTRSINRRDGADTDTRGDWYIVPTRGSTFGAPNLGQVYVP